MAEFVELMRQKERLCKWVRKNGGCNSCPIEDIWCEQSIFDIEMVRKTEEIVMQWAKEHPEPVYPTVMEWQRSIYRGVEVEVIHPCQLWNCTDRIGSSKCREYTLCTTCAANERIPPDVAEKLGIKPIMEKRQCD